MCNSNREAADEFLAEVSDAAAAISGDCPRLAALADAGAKYYAKQIAKGERSFHDAKALLMVDMIETGLFKGSERISAKYGVDVSHIPECGAGAGELVGTPVGDVYLA